MSSTEHPETVPVLGPWDEDVEAILKRNPEVARRRRKVELDVIRGLLQSAWQHGYTSGMADSAKLHQAAAEEGA